MNWWLQTINNQRGSVRFWSSCELHSVKTLLVTYKSLDTWGHSPILNANTVVPHMQSGWHGLGFTSTGSGFFQDYRYCESFARLSVLNYAKLFLTNKQQKTIPYSLGPLEATGKGFDYNLAKFSKMLNTVVSVTTDCGSTPHQTQTVCHVNFHPHRPALHERKPLFTLPLFPLWSKRNLGWASIP